jgi:hypothetical protein
LFKKELDKVYDPNAPEDDMREREEEMERMREHVFRESDTDKNRLISFDEFLAETKREEFEKDPGTNVCFISLKLLSYAIKSELCIMQYYLRKELRESFTVSCK